MEGNPAHNYGSIACLPLIWKLLTCVLVEKVYAHFSEKNVLPDEQKGCRKDSRGTKDQIFSKEIWITKQTACNGNLGKVNIRRAIIQGDCFSTLLFVVVFIPLLIILNETDLRYVTR